MTKPSGPYETVVPTQGRSDRVANAMAYMSEMCRYANTGRLGLETLARLQCGPGLRLVKDGTVWVVAGVPIGLLDETAEEREAELAAAASLPGVTRASDLVPAVTENVTENTDTGINVTGVTENSVTASGVVSRGRGRPRTGTAMSDAERQRARRERLKGGDDG